MKQNVTMVEQKNYKSQVCSSVEKIVDVIKFVVSDEVDRQACDLCYIES